MPRTLPVALLAAALLLPASSALAAKSGYRAEIRRTTRRHRRTSRRATTARSASATATRTRRTSSASFADIVTTVSAQRSRYFGADASYADRRPRQPRSRTSSAQRIKDERTVERLAKRTRPHGPGEGRARRPCAGFAAGYNAYLRKHRPRQAARPDAAAARRGSRPITALDLYRRFYQLGLRASSGNFLREIVNAAPPAAPRRRGRRAADARAAAARLAGDPVLGDRAPARLQRLRRRLGRHARRPLACCSATRTSRGRAPSAGTSCTSRSPASSTRSAPRCRACRSSTSASTSTSRWSHTVSTARRFTPYELKLKAGDPTQLPRRRQGREDAPAHRLGAHAVRRPARTRSTRRAGGRCSTSRSPA